MICRHYWYCCTKFSTFTGILWYWYQCPYIHNCNNNNHHHRPESFNDFIFSSPSMVFWFCLLFVCQCPTSYAFLQLPAFVCQVPRVSLGVAHLCLSPDLRLVPHWPRPTGGFSVAQTAHTKTWAQTDGAFFFFFFWSLLLYFTLPKAIFLSCELNQWQEMEYSVLAFPCYWSSFPTSIFPQPLFPQLKKQLQSGFFFFCQYYLNAHQENDNSNNNGPCSWLSTRPGRLFHVGCCETSVLFVLKWKIQYFYI